MIVSPAVFVAMLAWHRGCRPGCAGGWTAPRRGDDGTVNRWLLRAPWWALALVNGVVIAPVLVLVARFGRGDPWPVALVGGVLGGAVCGAIVATVTRMQFHRRPLDAVGDVPDDVRTRVASRGTLFGPVPDDPHERAATLTLLEDQLARMREKRPVGVAMHLVLIGLCLWRALAGSPWWWAGVVVFAVLLGGILLVPRLGQRRAELLRRP